MSDGQELVKTTPGGALATTEDFGKALTIDPNYIEQTKSSLALLRTMVNDILVQGRDYGSVPGIPKEFLWQPGADLIIASFNCHVGEARVLNMVDTEEKIAITLEVPIISHKTGQEVACGIGAASTLEVKHKYRNVKKEDLPDWGYTTQESIAALKQVKSKWGIKYRILNPEHEDLLNTIWKIARKRGKSAAAQSLPGVSSALSEKLAKKKEGQAEQKPTNQWDLFWADLAKMGVDSKTAHKIMNVEHMGDLVRQGWTLEKIKDHIAHNIPGKEATPRQEPTVAELKNVKAGIDESMDRREQADETSDDPDFDKLESASKTELTSEPINMDWLKESLDKIRWLDVGKWIRENCKGVEGKTVRDMINQMTQVDRGKFVKEVQVRLDKLGK